MRVRTRVLYAAASRSKARLNARKPACTGRISRLSLACPSCGFSSSAHNAGLKVTELKAEIMVAVATVTANCR